MAALIDPGARTLDEDLRLIPFAYVFFYDNVSGDPTPAYAQLDVRQDPEDDTQLLLAFSRPHPNPMRSDAAGRLPTVFLDNTVAYRMVMTDADLNLLQDVHPFTTFPGPQPIAPKDNSGAAMPLCRLTLYLAHTTIVAAEHTADVNGEFEEIELLDETVYRAVLHNADGELIYDVEPYLGSGQGLGGMGGCMCPEHAFLFTENGADRVAWTNINGLTFSNIGTGFYQVDFTASTFTYPPIVTVNALYSSDEGAARRYAEVVEVTVGYAIIHLTDEDGVGAEGGFHLQAFGPENYLAPSSG